MKQLSFLLLPALLFIATDALAQKKGEDLIEVPELPYNKETSLVSYDGVVEVSGANQADLYKRGNKWFNSYFNNPANVIQEDNEQEGKMYGKHRFNLWMTDPKTNVKTNMGLMMYEVTLWFKDGRYKYEVTNFNKKSQSAYPLEKIVSDNGNKYVREYASYIVQTDEYARELVANLKKAMSTGDKPKSDGW